MGLEIAIILLVIAFILGFLLGGYFAKSKMDKTISGNICIDDFSDYDGPYMFLELSNGLGDILGKNYIYLGVKKKKYTKD